LLRSAGWISHDGVGLPPILASWRFFAVSADETPGRHIGVAYRPDSRVERSWFTLTIQLAGSTVGEADEDEEEGRAARFTTLLNCLGASSTPIDQVDFVTRITPARLNAQQVWDEAHAVDAESRQALAELAAQVSLVASEVTYWMVLRFPRAGVERYADRRDVASGGGFERVLQTIRDVTEQVLTWVEQAGLSPVRVLGPARLAALLRTILDPSGDLDALDMGTGWQLPAFTESANRTAVSVEDGRWLHSVAVVPANGWPLMAVDEQVLSPVLVDCSDAPYRIIQVQFPLTSTVDGIEKARTAAAIAEAKQADANTEAGVTSGEESIELASASVILDDMVAGGAACAPLVRIMVSATDMVALMDAREQIQERFSRKWRALEWCDGDQVRQVLSTFPLGLGAETLQRGKKKW
jgi:hypothetical protein